MNKFIGVGPVDLLPRNIAIVYAVRQRWTMEREFKRQELNRPNPAHVVHLRAGIEEFRALLARRHG